jgi:hypothetical protein
MHGGEGAPAGKTPLVRPRTVLLDEPLQVARTTPVPLAVSSVGQSTGATWIRLPSESATTKERPKPSSIGSATTRMSLAFQDS